MPYSYVTYVADGTTTVFSVPFPFIAQAHVTVKVGGSIVPFSWTTSATVQLATAPPSGSDILVQRKTPVSPASVVFNDGGTLTALDLNTTIQQSLFAAQEVSDQAASLPGLFKEDNLTVAGGGSLSHTTYPPNGKHAILTVQGQAFFLSSGAFSISGTTITWNSGLVGWDLQPGWQVGLAYTYNNLG